MQEFCAGGSLANFLQQGHARSAERGLNWARALILMRDVAAGMAYVHKQGIGAPRHSFVCFHSQMSAQQNVWLLAQIMPTANACICDTRSRRLLLLRKHSVPKQRGVQRTAA